MFEVFIIDKDFLACYGFEGLCGDFEMIPKGHSSDCEDAIKLFDEIDSPDVVVIDILQFGSKGIDLIRQLSDRNISCIVRSYCDSPWFVKTMQDIGAKGFVPKGSRIDTLFEVILLVGKGEQYFQIRGQKGLTGLSRREMQVMMLIGEGRNSKVIARSLHISPKTVETHRSQIKEKLSLFDGNQLCRAAAMFCFLGINKLDIVEA